MITHAELTAKELLDSLPPATAQRLRAHATAKRQPITEVIKEGLLLVADQIVAAQARTAGATTTFVGPAG
jgi:hypothetical protein